MKAFTKEQLEALVPPAADEPAKLNGHSALANGPSTKRLSDFDIPAFLAKHSIESREAEPYQGGQKWLLEECPFCHNRDHCAVVYKAADGTLGFSCSHNSCKSKYHWHDFRKRFEPEYDQQSEQQEKDSQPEKLVTLALQSAEKLFMTPKGEMYIRLRINSHIETLTISERGGAFKRWLVYHYREAYGTIPNANALTQAITALEAQAQWGGTPQQETYIRVASYGSNMYLDLANAHGEVVEITPQGWKITKKPPVCFRHPEGMLPLPLPIHGGNLDDLQPFVNTKGEHWILLKAYILGMLHPTGPYPILNLNGEKGTAKSSIARLVRMIIDPHQATLRRAPKDDQSFAIMAQNNYVVAFDNLSFISSRFSDLLCTLSTGAGDAYRKHYSNDEECIFNALRPQIFTGIEDLATRGDLIDRCINIKLQPIVHYKDEATLKREFEAAHPSILGALLDLVSVALRNVPGVPKAQLPRMADFALWVLAAEEQVTGECGTFLNIYQTNLAEGIDAEIEASLVGGAIVKFVASLDAGTPFEEKAGELLARLKGIADEDAKHAKAWPKNARALSGQLKRLAPSLRARGISVVSQHRNDGSYIKVMKNSDANSDAKSKNDANSVTSDTKDSASVTESIPDMKQSDAKVTQSDANITSSPFSVQKEKVERREESRERDEKPENLRHFASVLDFASSAESIEQKSTDEKIAHILAQLRPGKFVIVAGPDGAAMVASVGPDSVKLDHYGTIKKYTGVAILDITP